jgi:hypothetical protein
MEGARMKFWLPFLVVAAIIVLLTAYVHSRELANTMLAFVVFIILSLSLGVPSGDQRGT